MNLTATTISVVTVNRAATVITVASVTTALILAILTLQRMSTDHTRNTGSSLPERDLRVITATRAITVAAKKHRLTTLTQTIRLSRKSSKSTTLSLTQVAVEENVPALTLTGTISTSRELLIYISQMVMT